jgi:apolipoprotein D and lipocalin family protein
MSFKSLLLTFFIVLVFLGCTTKHPHLETVKSVDLEKYKGTWYEIARFEHFFEKGCKNVTATYSLTDDNKIKVLNSCTKIDSNEKKEATGVAYAVDNTNSKLKVSFFRPFYGDYWIIDLADDYSYVAVGTPSREYLWILSRTKTIDNEIKNKLINRLEKAGFETNKFIWVIQE